jgi:adenosyl cobinamide kinase/adenosyl cobinamide phosphate guanylyltransferase
MVKQLAENLSTHVDQHVFDCLLNWLNNQIRARLSDKEYKTNQRTHIDRRKKCLDPDLKIRFDELKGELKQ